MNLVWKLLRQHVSIPQFVGFFFANLFGLLIVLLGYQFYRDVLPVFTSDDSFMKADYIIVSKRIGTSSILSANANTFTAAEMTDVEGQPFVKSVGTFTSAGYKIDAAMGINGTNVLNSELPIESVPDEFVDVSLDQWKFLPGSKVVPIILPRSYITMYNFGFAQSHSLPKISDGLVGLIDFKLFVRGNGLQEQYTGKVIGFSSRLNSILVPRSFMEWSNGRYAPQDKAAPTRLIMEVKSPADERIAQYIDSKGYEVDTDKLNAEKTTYFLKLVVSMVMAVGLVISVLSFYILMLSIYLLVQKNSSKLENLLLIGYSPRQVAFPYQMLTLALNAVVLMIALLLLLVVRGQYLPVLETLFPQLDEGTVLPSLMVGAGLLTVVSLLNVLAIRRKIMRIWWRKE